MNTENPFINKMEKHTNEKLVYILTTDKEGFQPLALEAAKIVLDARDISENEKALIEEKIQAKETAQKSSHENIIVPKSLFKGPGLIVTIVILVSLMLLVENRSWGVTMLIALVGFGIGHAVNHYYFANKKKKNQNEVLDQ